MDHLVTGFGFKIEIEKASATPTAQGTDSTIALNARANKRFIDSLTEFSSIGKFPYTMLLPNSWCDSDDDDGWSECADDDSRHESHCQASATSSSDGSGFNARSGRGPQRLTTAIARLGVRAGDPFFSE